jgi:hypothetical protein
MKILGHNGANQLNLLHSTVGVTGKYGTRYGASLRKQVKKMEITQHAKYTCTFCGKVRIDLRIYFAGTSTERAILENSIRRHTTILIYSNLYLFNRTLSSALLLVSGSARAARRSWLVVLGLSPPLLLLPFALLSVVFVKWLKSKWVLSHTLDNNKKKIFTITYCMSVPFYNRF